MKREIKLEELKKIQLDILDCVAKFCDDNGISYFLAYGTLLGAIRHKGYIPWDDDIDIALPRSDFKKFMDIFNNSQKYDFKVVEYQTYAKVYNVNTELYEGLNADVNIGVNIDLFPIDGLGNDKESAISTLKKSTLLYKLYVSKILSFRKSRKWYKNLFLFFIKILLLIVPRNSLKKYICRLGNNNFYDSKYVGMIVAPYGANELMLKSVFEKNIDVYFENRIYKIPFGYDEYLRNLYGNYMEYPPKEKQVSHHLFKAYWK